MATTTDRPTTRAGGSTTALRALQVGALLGVASVVWQFVTAGHLVQTGQWLGAHSGGAVVLHVLTGLAALAAVWWRVSGGRTGIAVLAVVTFALTFLQAWSGDHAPLSVHIPLSLTVVGGTVWLLVAAVGAGRRTA